MSKYLVKIALPSRKNRWEASVVERTIEAENFNGMLMKAITPDELAAGARIFEIEELATMVKSFYFPLTVYNHDNLYFGGESSEKLDSGIAVRYRSYIEQAFQNYQGNDNMAEYFDEYDSKTAYKKIKYAEWKFEEVNGCLWGKVNVSLTENLTKDETEELKDWISGQNSDGLGEGFEQQEIRTYNHTISVSFWNPDDNYRIYDEIEFGNIRFGLN
jgi:hypothetical protein